MALASFLLPVKCPCCHIHRLVGCIGVSLPKALRLKGGFGINVHPAERVGVPASRQFKTKRAAVTHCRVHTVKRPTRCSEFVPSDA